MSQTTRRSFLAGSLALAVGPVLIRGATGVAEATRPLGAAEPITLDARRQLFLDDFLIASMKGARRMIEPARKHPANPVLWPTEDWEDTMATVYGSVLRDGGRFRMWYHSRIGVGYAESDDGLKWERVDRKSTRLNSSHCALSRMPSSA